VAAVDGNHRIEVNGATMERVVTASYVQRSFGTIDPRSGDVTVTNPRPAIGGYVAADPIPPELLGTRAGVRGAVGIDTDHRWYDRYAHADDPLYLVRFRTKVELDSPAWGENARETGFRQLGGIDPATHHRPGTGLTKGGLREGVLPDNSPIEILEIVPVGEDHVPGGYPAPPPQLTRSEPPGVRGVVPAVSGSFGGLPREEVQKLFPGRDEERSDDDDLDEEFD
jgi:hypothetical protein